MKHKNTLLFELPVFDECKKKGITIKNISIFMPVACVWSGNNAKDIPDDLMKRYVAKVKVALDPDSATPKVYIWIHLYKNISLFCLKHPFFAWIKRHWVISILSVIFIYLLISIGIVIWVFVCLV